MVMYVVDAAYSIIDLATGERVQLSQCFEEKDLGIWQWRF